MITNWRDYGVETTGTGKNSMGLVDLIKESPKPTDISSIARKMGVRLGHGELSQIGKIVAKTVRREYNIEPEEGLAYVHNRVRPLKLYTEEHEGLIRKIIIDFNDQKSSKRTKKNEQKNTIQNYFN